MRVCPTVGSAIMPIEKWSDNVALVHLADDPQFSDDLEAIEQQINSQNGAAAKSDVVLDFAAVHFVNSSNISRLLKLRKQMIGQDAKLVLCGVSTQVWGAFLVTGLDKVFNFSDDVPTALASLQLA